MIKIDFHNDREPALDETTLNTMQDNIENAINKCKIISATETLCGTFKGQNMYRLLLETTTSAGYNTISLSSISNLGTIVNIAGTTIQYNSTNIMPLFYYNNAEDMCRCYYDDTENALKVQCGTSFGFGSARIVLEYTKMN